MAGSGETGAVITDFFIVEKHFFIEGSKKRKS